MSLQAWWMGMDSYAYLEISSLLFWAAGSMVFMSYQCASLSNFYCALWSNQRNDNSWLHIRCRWLLFLSRLSAQRPGILIVMNLVFAASKPKIGCTSLSTLSHLFFHLSLQRLMSPFSKIKTVEVFLNDWFSRIHFTQTFE